MPRLTSKVVAAATPRERTYDIADDGLAGFCVRVTPAGCKTFSIRYRSPTGDLRRLGLGRFPAVRVEDARKRARQLLGEVARGEDPQATRKARQRAESVADLCKWYLEEYVPAKKRSAQSRRTDACYVRKHLMKRPELARKSVAAVSEHDIERLKREMADRPGAFRKVRTILRICFHRAEKLGVRPKGSNPCEEVKPDPERRMERFLSAQERKRLEEELVKASTIKQQRKGHIAPGAADAIRFLGLTGMRSGEVVETLCWHHVDWDHECLRLDKSKTGAKNIQLSEAALEFLRARYTGQPRERPVFVGDRGGRLLHIGRTWRMIRAKAGLKDVRLHDLRHAFASDAVMAGVPLAFVGKLLGHKHVSTTQRYAHIADDVLRNAANVAAHRITAATAGPARATVDDE
jgi:integrase